MAQGVGSSQKPNTEAMVNSIRKIIKPLLPLCVRVAIRRRFGWRWFRGDYATWAEARAASLGYDADSILERVRLATNEVRAGRAAFERDGIAFKEDLPHPRLVAALRAAAVERGGRLDVVDFGGALGSTWWQHRGEFSDLHSVRWRIVEQSHYVGLGQREYSNGILSFHGSVSEALAEGTPNAILLSSVLPYVEYPLALLREIAGAGFAHVIVDRTPVVRSGIGRLVVQRVPPALGGGSYPCWLFARDTLLAPLANAYRIADEWPGFDEIDDTVEYRGLHFARLTA